MEKEKTLLGCRYRIMTVAALSALSFLVPSPVMGGISGAEVSGIVQQNKVKVTGRVVDVDDNPILNATVRELGSSNGTVTDLDGNYVLMISPGSTLQISSIGYKNITKKIEKGGKLNFTMEEDASLLGEVVAIGYGKAKKGDLSAAVATVDNVDKLQKRPVSNVSQMLQGQIPGVSVVANGGHPSA